MRFLVSGALALLIIPLGASDARPRQAGCVVKASGVPAYRGSCRFIPGNSGSFAINPIGRRAFPGGIVTISVWMVSPGVAEVRGSTGDGINSRWGEARRSRGDPACWNGDDFSICAY